MCDYCRQYPCASRCPSFEEPDNLLVCSGCGTKLYFDDEYVVIGNSYYHRDCAFDLTAREVLQGFGIKSERIES